MFHSMEQSASFTLRWLVTTELHLIPFPSLELQSLTRERKSEGQGPSNTGEPISSFPFSAPPLELAAEDITLSSEPLDLIPSVSDC